MSFVYASSPEEFILAVRVIPAVLYICQGLSHYMLTNGKIRVLFFSPTNSVIPRTHDLLFNRCRHLSIHGKRKTIVISSIFGQLLYAN